MTMVLTKSMTANSELHTRALHDSNRVVFPTDAPERYSHVLAAASDLPARRDRVSKPV